MLERAGRQVGRLVLLVVFVFCFGRAAASNDHLFRCDFETTDCDVRTYLVSRWVTWWGIGAPSVLLFLPAAMWCYCYYFVEPHLQNRCGNGRSSRSRNRCTHQLAPAFVLAQCLVACAVLVLSLVVVFRPGTGVRESIDAGKSAETGLSNLRLLPNSSLFLRSSSSVVDYIDITVVDRELGERGSYLRWLPFGVLVSFGVLCLYTFVGCLGAFAAAYRNFVLASARYSTAADASDPNKNKNFFSFGVAFLSLGCALLAFTGYAVDRTQPHVAEACAIARDLSPTNRQRLLTLSGCGGTCASVQTQAAQLRGSQPSTVTGLLTEACTSKLLNASSELCGAATGNSSAHLTLEDLPRLPTADPEPPKYSWQTQWHCGTNCATVAGCAANCPSSEQKSAAMKIVSAAAHFRELQRLDAEVRALPSAIAGQALTPATCAGLATLKHVRWAAWTIAGLGILSTVLTRVWALLLAYNTEKVHNFVPAADPCHNDDDVPLYQTDEPEIPRYPPIPGGFVAPVPTPTSTDSALEGDAAGRRRTGVDAKLSNDKPLETAPAETPHAVEQALPVVEKEADVPGDHTGLTVEDRSRRSSDAYSACPTNLLDDAALPARPKAVKYHGELQAPVEPGIHIRGECNPFIPPAALPQPLAYTTEQVTEVDHEDVPLPSGTHPYDDPRPPAAPPQPEHPEEAKPK